MDLDEEIEVQEDSFHSNIDSEEFFVPDNIDTEQSDMQEQRLEEIPN